MSGRPWLCPAISLAIAVAIALLFGLSFWTTLLIAAVLICPVVAVWTYFWGQRPLPVPVGPVPETRGYTFDGLAPYYDAICRLVGIGRSFRARTLALAGLRSGERVLDVGCGTGVLTRGAAKIVGPTASVWGIDPTADMIRIARQAAAAEASTAQFKPAAIENLPFDADSFDVALISFVLHCLPWDLKQSGLRELHRVLRPEGRLLIVDLDRPRNAAMAFLARAVLRHPFMAAHLEGRTAELLRETGFVNVRTVGESRGLVSFWLAEKPA